MSGQPEASKQQPRIRPGQLWRWKSKVSPSRQSLACILRPDDLAAAGRRWWIWDCWAWDELGSPWSTAHGIDVVFERELQRLDYWQLVADVP